MIISVFDRIENILGKGENAGNQHFLLFPQCSEKAFFSDSSKGVIVCEWLKICMLLFLRKKFVTEKEMNKCMAEI